MTEPDPAARSGPPEPWPDLLAAYADGELDEAGRAAVEAWLADHPEARCELRTQRELSPGNWPLWRKAEPPLPAEDTWAAVRDRVADELLAEPTPKPAAVKGGRLRRAGMWLAGAVAAGAAAAAVVAALAGPRGVPADPPARPGPEVAAAADDPLAAFAVLPMATDADVDVLRVSGGAAGWLPVGADPLPGPLVLAGADDVELEDAGPSPAWPAGGPELTPGPKDAPMIFATKPR